MPVLDLESAPLSAAAGVPEEYIRGTRNPNDRSILALYRAGIPASYVAACGRLKPSPHHDEIIEFYDASGIPETFVKALHPISPYAVQTYWTIGISLDELQRYGLWAIEPNTVRRLYTQVVPVEYSLPLLSEGVTVAEICRLHTDGVAAEYALAALS